MQIRRLEVTNIRSFERGALDLGPGTTLLVGDVGAGKSSLLYAVEMALFGVAEVDAAYLVRHGTQHAEVAVTLEDDGHRYAVRRRFRRVRRRGRETYEPERLTYAEDGHPTAYSATEIRQRVIDLLGFPDNPNPHAHSDLWRWAIYVPQERMREILATGPEQRLETVRKALGVERYRTAAENAQLLSADLRLAVRQRREAAGRLAHWDSEFAEASQEADRLRVDRAALGRAASESEAQLAEVRGRVRAAEEALAGFAEIRRERERLAREDMDDQQASANFGRRRTTITSELDAATQEGEAIRPLAEQRGQLQIARDAAQAEQRRVRTELEGRAEGLRELARATADREATERRAREATDAVRRSTEAREDAARYRASLEAEDPASEPSCPTPRSRAELEGAFRSAVADEHLAVEQLARDRARLGQIEELLRVGVCPTCEQPVAPEGFARHRREAAQAVDRAERRRTELAEARSALDAEAKARDGYEQALERWTTLSRRRAEATTALARRDAELASANVADEGARREAEDARARVDRLRPLESDSTALRQGLEAVERRLEQLETRDREVTRATERQRALAALTERVRAEIARLDEDAATVTRRREARGTRIVDLELRLRDEPVARQAVAGAQAAQVTAERQAGEARAALVRTDTRLDALVERVALAERGRAERATLVAEATDLEAKAAWVGDAFRLAVLRMEKETLAHAQVAFDRAFARFFASLIDDPALVARTDVTFTPEVTISGQATPAEALSGGERTSLALAFRLALASVVRQLGSVRLRTLLLDEPTDGFSAEQVVRMGELLEELALPQVILVSHESELTGIADRTIRVVKVGGRSRLELDAGGPSEDEERSADEDAAPPTPRPEGPAPTRTR